MPACPIIMRSDVFEFLELVLVDMCSGVFSPAVYAFVEHFDELVIE